MSVALLDIGDYVDDDDDDDRAVVCSAVCQGEIRNKRAVVRHHRVRAHVRRCAHTIAGE